jgi:hypothetical protein
MSHQISKEKDIKMKKVLVLIAFVASLGLVWVTNPGSGLANGANGARDQNTKASAVVPNAISQFIYFTNAAHVANGIELRNRVSGTIQLRGVPAGVSMKAAYLYWNFSDSVAVGADTAAALFNGNNVTGRKTADNLDPCWGRTGNHTYRANVLVFIPPSNPNQDYQVVTRTGGATIGENPWLNTPAGTIQEGATLVVVFSSAASTAVVIYDALSGTEFTASLSITLTHPISLSGTGLYTMSGADGQRDTSGYGNFLSNETGFFNGTQISGPKPAPFVAASDWDGAAGLPLVQLWDVHTQIVSFTSASSLVSYSTPGDCLVPVVFVLQANFSP